MFNGFFVPVLEFFVAMRPRTHLQWHNHYPNRDTEQLYHIKSSLTLLKSISRPHSGNHFLIYIIIDFFRFYFKWNNNECSVCMYVCMCICMWLLLLNIVFLSFTHFVAKSNLFHFLLMKCIVWIFHNLFIQSPLDGHLVHFQFWAIIKRIAMNILVYVF